MNRSCQILHFSCQPVSERGRASVLHAVPAMQSFLPVSRSGKVLKSFPSFGNIGHGQLSFFVSSCYIYTT